MPQGLPSPDKLLAAIRMAASIVESSKTNFDKDQLACIRRWRAGAIPRLKTLKELLAVILNLETEGQKTRPPDDLEPAFGEFMPREPVPQKAGGVADAATTAKRAEKPETKAGRKAEKAVPRTRAEFAAWFVESFDAVRLRQLQEKRRIRDAEKKDPTLFLKRIQAKQRPLVVRPEVVAAVDKFLREAGVQVVNGCGLIGAECVVRLQPLYEYVERLQMSGRIPSYFPGVPDIVLDDLYVELSAAPDQRPDIGLEDESQDRTLADPKVPDHFGRWRLASDQQRKSPEQLLATAEDLPVVVLGDPGSGKSTLIRYLLQELGRGLVGCSKVAAQPVIPFRIALKEFAQAFRADGLSVLQYLVRSQLCVGEEEVNQWVSFLRGLTADKRPFRLILLVDGIDEASPDKDSYDAICREMADLSAMAKLVFTSRRAGFAPPVTLFEHYELVPLSDLSIQAMIRKWFRAVGGRPTEFVDSFTSWVFEVSQRQEMAGNPCLLALLCYLNEDKTGGHFLQATCRAHLYGMAVDKLRKDASREGVNLVDATVSLLAGFAVARYTGDGGERGPEVLFREEQAIGFLRAKLGDRGVGELEPFRVLDSWRRMRLVARWDLGALHHFIHQTFHEYFAARGLLLLPIEEVAAWLEKHRFNPYWREVWRFYAGLCRDHLPDGRTRFGQMICSVCVPEDEFGEVGFIAAPLCAEHGLRDTTTLLGYDLRDRLFDIVRSMGKPETGETLEMSESRTLRDPQLVPRVRVMVELDPRYFLGWVRQTLDQMPQVVSKGRQRTASTDSAAEALFAAIVLNCIHHPDALAYQREMIRREMQNRGLKPSDPPLGPCIATGRNESLCQQLVDLDLSNLSHPHRLRLVRYLACTRSQAAVVQLIRIANEANLDSKEGVEIYSRCLRALCDLRDSQAIGLARRLWDHPSIPDGVFDTACRHLEKLDNEEVGKALAEWLASDKAKPGSREFLHLLNRIKESSRSTVPALVDRMLGSPSIPVSLEATLWGLVLARQGSEGVKRFNERLKMLAAAPHLGEREWHHIGALTRVLAASRIPEFTVIEELAKRVPARLRRAWQGIWGDLIELRAIDSRNKKSAEWLVSEGIPLVESELKRCIRTRNEVPADWLRPWFQCTLPVLTAFARVGLSVWHALSPDDAGIFFNNFDARPELVPTSVARTLFESRNYELRQLGIELLVEQDPGFLMSKRRKSEVAEVLLQASRNMGVLFFKGQLYNPTRAKFVKYASQK